MDVRTRSLYLLIWGASWVVLSSLLAIFIPRSENLFADPGTWLATFPIAWTIALLWESSRKRCSVSQQPPKNKQSIAWAIPLMNGLLQPLIHARHLMSPEVREWIFISILSLIGFILCLVQFRKERASARCTQAAVKQ